MGSDEKYGKRRQITFRIGCVCEDRLGRVSALFNLKPTEYAKSLLYKDLGIFDEPLDKRRHAWKQKERQSGNEPTDKGEL